MSFARLCLWGFALFLATFPLIVLASRPSFDLHLIFKLSSYEHLRRDFAFVGIAVLAIGFVDWGEAMIIAYFAKGRSFLILFPLALVMVGLFLLFSAVSGETEVTERVNTDMVDMLIGAVSCSFAARITLVASS